MMYINKWWDNAIGGTYGMIKFTMDDEQHVYVYFGSKCKFNRTIWNKQHVE